MVNFETFSFYKIWRHAVQIRKDGEWSTCNSPCQDSERDEGKKWQRNISFKYILVAPLTLTRSLSRHHLKDRRHESLVTTQSPTTLFLVPLSRQASGSLPSLPIHLCRSESDQRPHSHNSRLETNIQVQCNETVKQCAV